MIDPNCLHMKYGLDEMKLESQLMFIPGYYHEPTAHKSWIEQKSWVADLAKDPSLYVKGAERQHFLEVRIANLFEILCILTIHRETEWSPTYYPNCGYMSHGDIRVCGLDGSPMLVRLGEELISYRPDPESHKYSKNITTFPVIVFHTFDS